MKVFCKTYELWYPINDSSIAERVAQTLNEAGQQKLIDEVTFVSHSLTQLQALSSHFLLSVVVVGEKYPEVRKRKPRLAPGM